MKRHARIDPIWRSLFAGDSFHSRLPKDRLIAIAETLAPDGYSYDLAMTQTGYTVTCTESPLKTPADGYALLTGTDRA